MKPTPRALRLAELGAGFLAICIVLAAAISIHAIAKDLRLLWVLTGTAFFVAGYARGRSAVHSVWSHGVLVSCPGLLGTAALIMNDGLHRLLMPIALAVTATLLTVAGIETRRLWSGSRRSSWLLCFISFAALAFICIVAVPFLSAHASVKHMDRSAPSFALSALDGTPLKSSDMRGRVVVLSFWTTWCLACHWELSEIESAYKRYQHDPEVLFLAVDMNWGGETPAKARDFLESKKLDLPAGFDSGGAARALGVDSLPTLIVLDQQGNIRMVHYGYDASEHIETVVSKSVQSLLSPPAKSW